MDWKKSGQGEWRLASSDFEGRAVLNETNEGFIASIEVKEDRFDMELLGEREFFESREEAEEFLKNHMEKDSY